MRHLILAAVIWASPAPALTVEDEAWFGPAAGRAVTVLSTTDIAAMAPLMERFTGQRGWRVHYLQAASRDVYDAVAGGDGAYDLVMSSAMGLQMRLANDGFARSLPIRPAGLPEWALWRDQLFGLGLEPVVTLISRRALGDLPLPATRRDLVAMLRENPDRFAGRIGSYDPTLSGVGYFLLAQETRLSDGFWRLAEVMGRLNPYLSCCSGVLVDMLGDGRLAIAYNVVASYANRAPDDPDLIRVDFADYTVAILRTGFVPRNARDAEAGAALLAWLLARDAQAMIAQASGVALIAGTGPAPPPALRPVRLDVGLLVDEDRARRAALLAEWAAAMTQP